MNLFTDSILELPSGMSSTDLYQLLILFDQAIIESYQVDYKPNNEYSAVYSALSYFYEYPESTTDESEIDLRYLTMSVLYAKSTRLFVNTLLNGNFSLDANAATMITTSSSDPYGIVVTLLQATATDTNLLEDNLTNLLNHLLYFHSIELLIDTLIHAISVSLSEGTYVLSRNINAVNYELYQ